MVSLFIMVALSYAPAQDAWFDCMKNRAVVLSKLSEPSATIADAAVGYCQSQQSAFELALKRDAMDRGVVLTDDDVARMSRNLVGIYRGRLLNIVMDERLPKKR